MADLVGKGPVVPACDGVFDALPPRLAGQRDLDRSPRAVICPGQRRRQFQAVVREACGQKIDHRIRRRSRGLDGKGTGSAVDQRLCRQQRNALQNGHEWVSAP
jgi:hypothetical protein